MSDSAGSFYTIQNTGVCYWSARCFNAKTFGPVTAVFPYWTADSALWIKHVGWGLEEPLKIAVTRMSTSRNLSLLKIASYFFIAWSPFLPAHIWLFSTRFIKARGWNIHRIGFQVIQSVHHWQLVLNSTYWFLCCWLEANHPITSPTDVTSDRARSDHTSRWRSHLHRQLVSKLAQKGKGRVYNLCHEAIYFCTDSWLTSQRENSSLQIHLLSFGWKSEAAEGAGGDLPLSSISAFFAFELSVLPPQGFVFTV